MYKATTFIGLVGLAAAGAPAAYSDPAPVSSAPAAYSSAVVDGSSAPAVYGSSASAVVYGSSSAFAISSSAFAISSSAFAVSSSAFAISSSAPVYPVSSSGFYVPSSTSSAEPAIPTCDCWTDCFEASGISSESELCGNSGVSQCIHDTCSSAEDQKYWSWYDSYCAVSSSSAVVVASSTVYVYSSSVSASASATPTPDCWNTCFDENDVTSEAELCGNCEVNKCIYETCSREDDMSYWSWYKGYCPAAPSSSFSTVVYSASVSSSVVYSASVSSSVVYSASGSSSVPVATPTGNCWNECFAENNVESEADLCGNTAVSQCIYDTCSSELDKAYWEWYGGYCAPATGTTTVVSYTTPTAPATWSETTPYVTDPYTTTYVQTEYPSSPIESSPVTTGWPAPPAYPSGPAAPPAYPSGPAAPPAYPSSPAAPPAYPSGPAAPPAGPWTSPYSYPPVASATGAAQPSASQWAPVPATGAGVVNKPAGIIAMIIAAAAFL